MYRSERYKDYFVLIRFGCFSSMFVFVTFRLVVTIGERRHKHKHNGIKYNNIRYIWFFHSIIHI